MEEIEDWQLGTTFYFNSQLKSLTHYYENRSISRSTSPALWRVFYRRAESEYIASTRAIIAQGNIQRALLSLEGSEMVTIEVDETGRVTLGGTVEIGSQKDQFEEIVEEVEGVDRVRNRIEVMEE